jgi:uncharacterized membrane protein (DUF485 family)
MYPWLLRHFNRPVANVLMFLWYFLMVLLIAYTADMQPGRFHYLQW